MPNVGGRVCVVGGGPAGLAAAIALRQGGAEVTVIDCRVPPVDKACGEGLLPDSLVALRRLGIELPGGAGFPFRGILFNDGHFAVAADFPNGLAYGVRRTVLHDLLIGHAARCGVSMLWGAKQVRLAKGGAWTNERFIGADLVVGADGGNSQIRVQASLARIGHEKRRYGFRRHYRVKPWSPYVELHWGRRAQIYVTPVAADEVCLAVVSSDPHLRLEQALRNCPQLAARVRGALPISRELGGLSVSRSLRRVMRDGVALAGDASGSVDAITGEGMGLAFRQALALAEAFQSGRIERYERAHRTVMRRPRMMASLLLTLGRHPQLQRRALAGLAEHPELFATLLAVHVGASSFRAVCSWRLLDFGRAFLAYDWSG